MTDAQTLSVQEAAALLGVGINATYRAAREGSIPAIVIGRSIRVPRAGLEQLLREGNVPRQERPLPKLLALRSPHRRRRRAS